MSVSSTIAADAPTAAATVAPHADTAKFEIAARREAMLHGPIVPLLLKLALPTVVVLAVQTLVGVAETYFVSFLGTDAIAGVALVFPVLMLMQMMSNGGIGGGVASAVARALGAGRKADVDALVLNAFAMAIVFGALFTLGELFGGARSIRRSAAMVARLKPRWAMPTWCSPARFWCGLSACCRPRCAAPATRWCLPRSPRAACSSCCRCRRY